MVLMNCFRWCRRQSKPSASVNTNAVVVPAVGMEKVGSPGSMAPEGGAHPEFLDTPLTRNLREKHRGLRVPDGGLDDTENAVEM